MPEVKDPLLCVPCIPTIVPKRSDTSGLGRLGLAVLRKDDVSSAGHRYPAFLCVAAQSWMWRGFPSPRSGWVATHGTCTGRDYSVPEVPREHLDRSAQARLGDAPRTRYTAVRVCLCD